MVEWKAGLPSFGQGTVWLHFAITLLITLAACSTIVIIRARLKTER